MAVLATWSTPPPPPPTPCRYILVDKTCTHWDRSVWAHKRRKIHDLWVCKWHACVYVLYISIYLWVCKWHACVYVLCISIYISIYISISTYNYVSIHIYIYTYTYTSIIPRDAENIHSTHTLVLFETRCFHVARFWILPCRHIRAPAEKETRMACT